MSLKGQMLTHEKHLWNSFRSGKEMCFMSIPLYLSLQPTLRPTQWVEKHSHCNPQPTMP